MISQKDLLKIRGNLPKAYAKTLEKRLKGQYSKSLIEKVVYGKRDNEDIIEAAIELAQETQNKKAALLERINTLT